MKMKIADTGYVSIFLAILLVQKNKVVPLNKTMPYKLFVKQLLLLERWYRNRFYTQKLVVRDGITYKLGLSQND